MELAPFNVRVVTVQPGAIASNFGNTAQTNLPEIDAIYHPYRDGIIKRAGMSQQNATTAKQFASFVVEKLLSPKGPPNIIRYGNGSLTLPLIAKWLPASLRYALFKKAFGLSSN
jgi:NAD(P)-dependent dehydrogenase (short-subunit alcohol dehydrogenase family)